MSLDDRRLDALIAERLKDPEWRARLERLIEENQEVLDRLAGEGS